ncbi:MAG: HD domain-containing phosphohydrolase [Gemmatimonadaceae bacterium]
MKAAVEFLTSLGQALAAMSLYAPGHNMRVAARQQLYENLLRVIPSRGVVRFSFLHGDAIVGSEVLSALRTWDWSRKLSAAGIQRIEVDAVPEPTNDDLEGLLQALHRRLQTKDGSTMQTIAVRGLRAGSLALYENESVEEPMESIVDGRAEPTPPSLTEETEAVRWVHDEAARGKAMPLTEVEGVVHGLAAAMHRDQHVLMPLLTLKTFDQYTTTHSCNVSMLSMGLAEQLGFAAADTRAVGTAALLHDIGKVRVPAEILVKTGRLTDDEMKQMQRHPVEGARMLSQRGHGHALAAVVAYEHHIWTNGKGGYPDFRYPRRCHYASRLVHVCDVYDALSTRRPYREAWPRERTLALLQDRAGIEFDVEIVDAFVAMSVRTKESRTPLEERPQNDWNATVAEAARSQV